MMWISKNFNSVRKCAILVTTSCAFSLNARAETSTLSATDFIKIRCNTQTEAAVTTWRGTVTTTGVAADRSQTLFKIHGYNIARCFKDEAGNWTVASRELTFYQDPTTGEILRQWQNPWTQETVNVVHIANALVQQKIPAVAALGVQSLGDTSIVRIDVPLSYPNPLAGDVRFADYSPEATYKAHESFSYVVSRKELNSIGSVDSIANVQVSWTRVSPWLPWMKMKGAAGQLVFNAIVEKQKTSSEIPAIIREQITQAQLELYLDAPRCIVKGQPNVTSWTYFKDNFDSYMTNAVFPRPETAARANSECTLP